MSSLVELIIFTISWHSAFPFLLNLHNSVGNDFLHRISYFTSYFLEPDVVVWTRHVLPTANELMNEWLL